MVLIKIGYPKEDFIVSKNNFVANKLLPVGFKSVSNNQFLLLFVANQDYDDSYIYLQILLNAEDPLEESFIKEHPLYINNIQPGTERYEAYQKMLQWFNDSNLFATDFDMKLDKVSNIPHYYHCTGIRAIDEKHASIMDIYIPRSNFIKMKLYLNTICHPKYSLTSFENEYIFMDPKLSNMEFVKIEKVKYDATCRSEIEGKKINISHYTLWCGPSEYRLNFVTPVDDDHLIRPLANPLNFNLYDVFYKKHFFVTDIIEDEEQVYVLYEAYSDIDNSFKGMKVLILDIELANKTNFVSYNNNIYEENKNANN